MDIEKIIETSEKVENEKIESDYSDGDGANEFDDLNSKFEDDRFEYQEYQDRQKDDLNQPYTTDEYVDSILLDFDDSIEPENANISEEVESINSFSEENDYDVSNLEEVPVDNEAEREVNYDSKEYVEQDKEQHERSKEDRDNFADERDRNSRENYDGSRVEEETTESYDEVEVLEKDSNQKEETANIMSQVETSGQTDYNAQAWNTMDIADESKKTAIFENVSYRQGQNDLGALGTCGPTSVANALNRVTGTSDYSENIVLHHATDRNLCYKSDNPNSYGGTTTSNLVMIIDSIKDSTTEISSEVYEYENALDVDMLADKVDNPNTVAIVGVDSAALWDQREDVCNSGLFQGVSESPSDHWITVDSPIRDENGNVTGFNVIDSGGSIDFVSKEKFERIYQGDANHRVSDPTAILIFNKINTER